MVQERPVRVERRLAAILAADVAGYSGLMHHDEEVTHAKLTKLLAEVVEPAITDHGGRIVKNTGDGFLAEFPSAVQAVRAAVQFQTRVKELTTADAEDRRITFRVGVNIGDVIVEPNDIFGDGVNIAARLESIAEPGGICISSSAYDYVRGKVGIEFVDMGEQHLKNIARPVRAYAAILDGRSGRLSGGHPDAYFALNEQQRSQQIRYCRSPDGVQIAYAISGKGPPILRAAHWMSHLQYEWESPVWRHWIDSLSKGNTFIRYDERGNGLSDWNASDLSFAAMVCDLESVADANGLSGFPLLGVSQSCAVSVAYAVRHPERVSHLVLYGGYAKGWRKRGDRHEIDTHEAMTTLIREGWGKDNPAFRQLFTETFIPGASREQMAWFNDLQKETASPDNASRLHYSFGDMDVSEILGDVSVPTLVLHARNDAAVPFEQGRALAAGIPGARFVNLNSANHILLSEEPAFADFVREVRSFISTPDPK